MCVCVCVCVRACVRACVRGCLRVCVGVSPRGGERERERERDRERDRDRDRDREFKTTVYFCKSTACVICMIIRFCCVVFRWHLCSGFSRISCAASRVLVADYSVCFNVLEVTRNPIANTFSPPSISTF